MGLSFSEVARLDVTLILMLMGSCDSTELVLNPERGRRAEVLELPRPARVRRYRVGRPVSDNAVRRSLSEQGRPRPCHHPAANPTPGHPFRVFRSFRGSKKTTLKTLDDGPLSVQRCVLKVERSRKNGDGPTDFPVQTVLRKLCLDGFLLQTREALKRSLLPGAHDCVSPVAGLSGLRRAQSSRCHGSTELVLNPERGRRANAGNVRHPSSPAHLTPAPATARCR